MNRDSKKVVSFVLFVAGFVLMVMILTTRPEGDTIEEIKETAWGLQLWALFFAVVSTGGGLNLFRLLAEDSE